MQGHGPPAHQPNRAQRRSRQCCVGRDEYFDLRDRVRARRHDELTAEADRLMAIPEPEDDLEFVALSRRIAELRSAAVNLLKRRVKARNVRFGVLPMRASSTRS